MNQILLFPNIQDLSALALPDNVKSYVENKFSDDQYSYDYFGFEGHFFLVKLGKNTGKNLILHGSNELFFTDREAYFERNRISISCEYKLNKQTSIQLGYLHQFDYRINDETGRDFLVIAYYLTLGKNEKPRLEKTLELKEE